VKRVATTLVAILTLSCLVFAQRNWTVSWKFEAFKVSDDVAELRAAGQTILRWRSQNALSQVQQLADRLNELLWKGTKPEAISVNRVPGGFSITVGSETLLTVTHQIARATQSDTMALANSWAQKLREVFSWRWLAAPLTELVVAVCESATVQLFGTAEGALQIEAIPPELVKIKIAPDARSFSVTGVDVGAGTLRVVKGTVGIRLPFRVLYRGSNLEGIANGFGSRHSSQCRNGQGSR